MSNQENHQAEPKPLDCEHEHGLRSVPNLAQSTLERAARIFQALGDPGRLRLLAILAQDETCVSELAALLKEELSTVSHRLRLLRAEGIVQRRRVGRHVHYSLLDHHVQELLQNAFEHAEEGSTEANQSQPNQERENHHER
ncbi:MAG: metalloregulator ArsR/SmtB family transcription factor [Polyangiaceae bacterium]|nr:metalloregulator ArsR/SmtB family transcription factor [Polyangiaceae bacterium]